MSALTHAVARLTAEFAGNARLRWGGWLMIGIVLLYCMLVQSDRLADIHTEYVAEAERLMKAESLLERQDWPEMLAAERKTHQKLTTMFFWQAETEGLAQAKLQAALNAMIEGLDLRDPRIHSGVSQSVPDLPGIRRVQTRLSAAYRPGVELQVLHAMAVHPKKLVVDRLELRRRTRQDSRLVLILSAYFVGVEMEQK